MVECVNFPDSQIPFGVADFTRILSQKGLEWLWPAPQPHHMSHSSLLYHCVIVLAPTLQLRVCVCDCFFTCALRTYWLAPDLWLVPGKCPWSELVKVIGTSS